MQRKQGRGTLRNRRFRVRGSRPSGKVWLDHFSRSRFACRCGVCCALSRGCSDSLSSRRCSSCVVVFRGRASLPGGTSDIVAGSIRRLRGRRGAGRICMPNQVFAFQHRLRCRFGVEIAVAALHDGAEKKGSCQGGGANQDLSKLSIHDSCLPTRCRRNGERNPTRTHRPSCGPSPCSRNYGPQSQPEGGNSTESSENP